MNTEKHAVNAKLPMTITIISFWPLFWPAYSHWLASYINNELANHLTCFNKLLINLLKEFVHAVPCCLLHCGCIFIVSSAYFYSKSVMFLILELRKHISPNVMKKNKDPVGHYNKNLSRNNDLISQINDFVSHSDYF